VTALLVSCGVLTVYALFPALYMDFRAADLLVALTNLTHLVAAAGSAVYVRSPVFMFGWIPAVLVTALIVWLLLRRTATRIAALALATPGPSLLHRIFAALDRFYEDISPERIRGIRLLPSRDGVWESRAVLWKELQTRASGRVRNSVRIALVLLLALAASFWVSLEYMIVPVMGTTGILWLLSLSNGSSLFVTEKEERKWDILLSTPLTSAEILGAKLLAGVVPVLPTVITILLFWTAVFFTHHLHTEDFVVVFGSVFLPAALAYGIGAICSLKARSLRGAFLWAFSIFTGVTLVLPWLQSYPRGTLKDSAWYSPMASLYWICDRGLTNWSRHVPDSLFWSSIAFDMSYAVFLGSMLLYLFLRFDRISGRSE